MDEDLGKVEYFCVSIYFLLNGQVDISTPSYFCEYIITHTDKLHYMLHLEKAKELLIRLSTQESASPGHQYTSTKQEKFAKFFNLHMSLLKHHIPHYLKAKWTPARRTTISSNKNIKMNLSDGLFTML